MNPKCMSPPHSVRKDSRKRQEDFREWKTIIIDAKFQLLWNKTFGLQHKNKALRKHLKLLSHKRLNFFASVFMFLSRRRKKNGNSIRNTVNCAWNVIYNINNNKQNESFMLKRALSHCWNNLRNLCVVSECIIVCPLPNDSQFNVDECIYFLGILQTCPTSSSFNNQITV